MSLLERFFDVDFWKQRVKTLSRDLNQTHDKMCEANKRASLLAMENEELKTQLQTAVSDCKEEIYNNEVEGNMRLLEARNASNQEIYRITREKEVVATELKNTKIVFEVVVKNLESQLQAAKEAAIKQDDALHDKEQEVEKLLTEISEVVYAKELLKNTLTSRDTKITELKEQLQTAISNYDERDHHYTTLEAAHIKLGAELDKSEQEIAKLTREKETLEVEGTDFINVLRSNKEDIDNLKAEVQIAEDDFDEMANLYTNLHKAFDDLVDTNVDLAKKLREATLHKTANEKLQRDVIDLQQYNAAVTAEVKKLQVASAEWDSMYKGYVTATNENSRLKAEKDSLSKTLAEAFFKNEQSERRISAFISDNAVLREEVIKTKFYNSRLENELQTVKNDLAKKDKVISDAEVKYGHDQTQAMRAISRQQDELSASIVKYVSLTDKVKVVEGIVKELMPVSMRFQTALFDLIEVPNVSGT